MNTLKMTLIASTILLAGYKKDEDGGTTGDTGATGLPNNDADADADADADTDTMSDDPGCADDQGATCISFTGPLFSGQEAAQCSAQNDFSVDAGGPSYSYQASGCPGGAVAVCDGLMAADESGAPVSGAEYLIYFYPALPSSQASDLCCESGGAYSECFAWARALHRTCRGGLHSNNVARGGAARGCVARGPMGPCPRKRDPPRGCEDML